SRVKELGLIQSMSRRGNCWDNAPQESFYGHMKDELNLDACVTYDDVVTEVDDYMDYYNHYRGQWTLNRMTPQNYYESLCT
ncbi:IS3 family transposase, partial [Vagococcus fluvialis]